MIKRLSVITALVLLLSLAGPPRHVGAQGVASLFSAADVTGTGAAASIASLTGHTGSALWVQIVALSTNSATVRCGDSNVGTARGVPLAAGAGLFLPLYPADDRQSVSSRYYNLSAIYCYIANGDKIAVTVGN